VRKLGVGGMGTVYECVHSFIGRRYAIKFLHRELSERRDSVRRFQREAQAATAIGHRNIVECTDMGQHSDGTVFMVLEYLDGRDLQKELEAVQTLELDRAVRIFSQICDALSAAHAHNIVHRDLKPENIFLIERDGDRDFVKVLDFGVAKFISDDPCASMLTQTGMAIGTCYYMSPEQAQGLKTVDQRSDVFSLGVLLFQALAGRRPFEDENQLDLMLAICTKRHPSIKRFRPDLPDALETIIDTMLAKPPDDRYGDLGQARRDLERLVSQ
jgi:serine/threonine-protein kinase